MPPPSQGYLTLAGAWVAEAAGLGTDPDDPLLGPPAGRGVAGRRARPARGALRRRRRRRPCSQPERLAAAAAGRRRANGPRRPTWRPGPAPPAPHVARLGDGDTTHLCALDADGLGVSLTQSNALDFGSHLIEPATGIFLHNRGVGFSLVAGHPAEVGARAGGRPTPCPPCW